MRLLSRPPCRLPCCRPLSAAQPARALADRASQPGAHAASHKAAAASLSGAHAAPGQHEPLSRAAKRRTPRRRHCRGGEPASLAATHENPRPLDTGAAKTKSATPREPRCFTEKSPAPPVAEATRPSHHRPAATPAYQSAILTQSPCYGSAR